MSKHCLNFSLCWRRRKARIRFYFFCFLRFLRWSALFLIILFASKRKRAVLSLGITEKGSLFSHKGFRPASCLAADHSSPQLKTGDCFFSFLTSTPPRQTCYIDTRRLFCCGEAFRRASQPREFTHAPPRFCIFIGALALAKCGLWWRLRDGKGSVTSKI